MKNTLLLAFVKNPKFILTLILLVFFLKGVFMVAAQPIFGGQDEARHYNTIQLLAQPTSAVSATEKDLKTNDYSTRDKDDLETYNFSQEIQKTATATDTDVLRGELFNTIDFSNSDNGLNESEINAHTWKPYNYYAQPDIAGNGNSLYHQLGAQIE